LLQSDIAAVRARPASTSYTAIRAPMSGRVGAINVYPGSLVQLATSLTTITQLDPITVAFTCRNRAWRPCWRRRSAARSRSRRAGQLGQGAGHRRLSFIDNTVDPAAGTIRVKAEFDNRDTTLWPGQYVNTKVTVQTMKDAVVVPQNAIITNTRGTFVYVLDADHSAKVVRCKRLYGAGDWTPPCPA
jgi:multidrug efflux system membrane fusion protein